MLRTDRIRELREAAGMTQEQAAQRAGFASRQHWNKIEGGRAGSVTIETLCAIARALGCKAGDLIECDGEKAAGKPKGRAK